MIFLPDAGIDADPVEMFEDAERSGLTLIGLVVVAAAAVAILGVAAQLLA
jgi:hypothetical protein